jgi:macrolide transport system ATP-binding/permease protein
MILDLFPGNLHCEVLNLLIVIDLSKSYGPNIVLNRISFGLNKGVRAGLVGINGVGKSTLLKVLAGLEPADSGRIIFNSPVIAGYLPQNLPSFQDLTIDRLLMQSVEDIKRLELRMREIEQAVATATGNNLPALMEEYSQISTEFHARGGYEIDHRIESIIEGLGIGHIDRSRPVDTLSGGEKTRLNLATILLKNPDLLLLDEPTNNLDAASLEWLEAYLSHHPGAILAASHDRQFLNKVVTFVFEIDEHTHHLKTYAGNYDAFKSAKLAERTKWEEDYRNQQEEISELRKRIKSTTSAMHTAKRTTKSRDNDKFVRYFKSQRLQESISRSIRDAAERLRRIQEDPIPKPPRPLRFKAGFTSLYLRSAEVIRVSNVTKKYGAETILSDITFWIRYDSRVVITGLNGAGKTTLLKIMAGKDIPDRGQVTYAPDVHIGFLSQEPEVADPGRNLLDYYSYGLTGYQEDFIFGLVTCGLFRYDELNKTVGQLSLGQIRKLQIARLIASDPNALILDEPTNHLSLDVLESFESAISDFEGPIIAVSHDRRFIKQFGGEIWELTKGTLINHGKLH